MIQRPAGVGARRAAALQALVRLLLQSAAPLAWYGLVWWLPTCIALYLKRQMIGGDGLAIAARSLGKVEVIRGDTADWEATFTLWEKLTFYRGELLWGLVVLPLVTFFLTSGPRGRRWRGTVFAVSSILTSCLLYAELLSVRAVGRMLSLTLASDALTFGACCGGTAREYFGVRGVALLLGVVLLTVAVAWWAGRHGTAVPGTTRRRTGHAVLVAAWGLLYVLTFVSWLPWLRFVPYHTSVFATAATTFFSDDAIDTSEYAGLSPDQLALRYRELTHTPAPRQDAGCWGKAQGCDVLVFVLETAPARCLDLGGDLSNYPNLARLRQRSWVATRHHSTYPYTSRAVFSLVSSWHPSTLMKGFPQRHPNLIYPGLMQSLQAAGYHTALYAPDAFTYRADDRMYQSMGIGHRFYAELAAAPGANGAAEDDRQRRRRLDRECLRALQRDMRMCYQDDKRFAALFLPQIGHGPWLDFTDGAAGDDLMARGRKLLAIQDAWLGDILDHLAAAGRLEKTLIVVVGDHGIRTRREDPTFRPGMVDDYSFHVPFLLYAPPALRARHDVDYLTSHIDVAPSLLDLLGVYQGRDAEQGAPIWDERLRGRNTYFLGNHLIGSDGYCNGDGHYYMWNHLTGAVYESTRLHFDADGLLPRDSPRYGEVLRHLKRAVALHEVWAKRRCCPAPRRPGRG